MTLPRVCKRSWMRRTLRRPISPTTRNRARPLPPPSRAPWPRLKASPAQPGTVKQAAADSVGKAAPITKATLAVDTLNLEAANEGVWGNKLRARVDRDVVGPDAA